MGRFCSGVYEAHDKRAFTRRTLAEPGSRLVPTFRILAGLLPGFRVLSLQDKAHKEVIVNNLSIALIRELQNLLLVSHAERQRKGVQRRYRHFLDM